MQAAPQHPLQQQHSQKKPQQLAQTYMHQTSPAFLKGLNKNRIQPLGMTASMSMQQQYQQQKLTPQQRHQQMLVQQQQLRYQRMFHQTASASCSSTATSMI